MKQYYILEDLQIQQHYCKNLSALINAAPRSPSQYFAFCNTPWYKRLWCRSRTDRTVLCLHMLLEVALC